MNEKIYTVNDIEYQEDGYLKIDNDEFYTIQKFKRVFEFNYKDILDNNKQNDNDSVNLFQKVNKFDVYRIKPEQTNEIPYLNCYRLEDLEEFYNSKI